MLNNPFPSIPVPGAEVRVFIDRDEIMKEVSNVTKDCFNTGKSQTIILQGNYGNGKSHTLRYIKSRINAQLATREERRGIASYVQSPGASIADLVSSIVEDLGFDFLRIQAYSLLANFFNSRPDRMRYVIGPEAEKGKGKPPTIPSDIVAMARLLRRENLRLRELLSDLIKTLQVKLPDFAKSFFQLVDEPVSGLAWRWLLGENLSRAERESLDVTSDMEGSENALSAFATLRTLLEAASFPVMYILVDEFEKVSETRTPARSRYFDDLRHFIDQNDTGVCLIACVSPTGWTIIRGSGHPLSRRLLGNVHWLESFGRDEIKRLVAAHIALARQEYLELGDVSAQDLKRKVQEKSADLDLYPFSEGAVTILYDVTKGNISEVIRLCKKLLDAGCDSDYPVLENPEQIAKMIGVEAAQDVLS